MLVALATIAAGADGRSIGVNKFVDRADNLCQPQVNDARRHVHKGRRLIRHRRLGAAGKEFITAYRELRRVYRQVGRLPRPHGRGQRIGRWLNRERRATAIGVDAARALRREHLREASRLTLKATRLEHHAAYTVRRFDFRHCVPL